MAGRRARTRLHAPYNDAEFPDSIAVIECGVIELESVLGTRLQLRRGHLLWLTGLPIRALHNRGLVPAVLIVVTRRRDNPRWGTRFDRARIL